MNQTSGGQETARAARPRGAGLTPAPRAALVFALLYLFLIGVSAIETGIKALGSGFQEGLLESVANPISGVFAGILATVLVQSSSVSTSTIVGLVGAGTLTVGAAVPMIMGANIGTTVTNTLASLGSIRRPDEFRRAFAGATVHDFFNLLSVIVLLPVELATGFLRRSASALAGLLGQSEVRGGATDSPIKAAVKAPVKIVEAGLESVTEAGTVIGIVLLVFGLGCIFVALAFITRNMRELVAGRVERAMNRIIGRGGGAVGIVVGILVTVAVQSSSITTSILVPMVAAGVLTLPNVFPITLGANVGTTVTALLASLAVARPEGLVIALVHTLFNVTGIALVYPVPAVRMVPIRLARGMADIAVRNRSVITAYVVGLFVLLPLAGVAFIP